MSRPVVFTVPIRTVSGANAREHWSKKAARAKAERTATAWSAKQAEVEPLGAHEHALITIVRIAPRQLDSDNLAIAGKHVRDELAAALGLADDRDGARLAWRYRQEQGRPNEYAVRVEITIATVPQDGAA